MGEEDSKSVVYGVFAGLCQRIGERLRDYGYAR